MIEGQTLAFGRHHRHAGASRRPVHASVEAVKVADGVDAGQSSTICAPAALLGKRARWFVHDLRAERHSPCTFTSVAVVMW